MPATPSLLIVGAGPKALALAAKATVLHDLGLDVPDLHIVERSAIGAHWQGGRGYTDGRQILGTPPEKDVGFPYATTVWGPGLGDEVAFRMQRFSWPRYLTANGQYAEWIDRGRPAPEHRQWAAYLQWVAGQVGERVHWHTGEVTGIGLEADRWQVTVSSDGPPRTLPANGLMLTGPGKAQVPASLAGHRSVLTVESFWQRRTEFLAQPRKTIVIIGSGETAAAVALGLMADGYRHHRVVIISPNGMTYSRGEGYRENRVYSDPDQAGWRHLTEDHRRDFIRRTDRGVFSQQALRQLDHEDGIEITAGRLLDVTIGPDGLPQLALAYGEAHRPCHCDVVILATGGDHLQTFLSVTDQATQAAVMARSGLDDWRQETVERAIADDLSLAGLTPKLYLPMLAGLAQGPGFPNLSSLGLLADRVLAGLVDGDRRSTRDRAVVVGGGMA